MSVPMIAGYYPYRRGGVTHPPRSILTEIPQSLVVNPSYATDLLILAGDAHAAEVLEGFGLKVVHQFNDAPEAVHNDSAHKMKHWMCLWALERFSEFLWIDWDTVLLQPPDAAFWEWCRYKSTPKFLKIPNYWATVNCGVYYANADWLPAMRTSFAAEVSEPNDELLWASVLPANVRELEHFWWQGRVENVWSKSDFASIGANTYFAHVHELDWATKLRDSSHCASGR
jgi:hypothetical protein